MSVRRLRANQTPRDATTCHVRHIFMQDDQIIKNIFLSRNQFVNYKQFSPIFIIAPKAGNSSSLHTIILRNKTHNKPFIDLIFLCIFLLSLGLDTSKQFQSILTLIVQTTVSAVLGTISKQQQGAFESVLLVHFLLVEHHEGLP